MSNEELCPVVITSLSVCLCVADRVKTLAAHRRARLNEAQTLHQFFRDIDDEEAWIKYVML